VTGDGTILAPTDRLQLMSNRPTMEKRCFCHLVLHNQYLTVTQELARTVERITFGRDSVDLNELKEIGDFV
jgi:hypothetical protein